MPNIRKLQTSATRTIRVEFGGEMVEATYYPAYATPRLWERVKATIKSGEEAQGDEVAQARFTSHLLCELLIEWNLTETGEDGAERPVPITPETFFDLPAALMQALMQAIVEADAPNPTTSGTLSSTSAPAEPAVASPTGTS